MKKDIILSGVGGQGILSIATIIGDAATKAGLNLKQAEVHGMSQRGGEVESGLRLSDTEIYSDLVPLGSADMILSMEPMEALRYLPFLHPDGYVITSFSPFKNISNYPEEKVQAALANLKNVVTIDLDQLRTGNPSDGWVLSNEVEIWLQDDVPEVDTYIIKGKIGRAHV